MISQHSILVVEDEPLILIDAIDMMEDEGFTAYEATNADSALQVLEAHSDIDVLFTDIDMPGPIDGLMLARTVRDRWPHIAIVIVSGQRKPTGGDMPTHGQFVPKPYLRAAIIRALRDTIERTKDKPMPLM